MSQIVLTEEEANQLLAILVNELPIKLTPVLQKVQLFLQEKFIQQSNRENQLISQETHLNQLVEQLQ